jgi:uncharacterized damage-inducible protein DinB
MNADQATAIVQLLTGTIESEGGAVHLAISDIWFADSILRGQFEWTGEPATPAEMSDPAAVAKWHETHMTDRLGKLRAMSADDMLRNVEFFGMKGPACTWLAMMNNHSVHHRGQLAAYLRAAGSKVPAIYGMSADENAFG